MIIYFYLLVILIIMGLIIIDVIPVTSTVFIYFKFTSESKMRTIKAINNFKEVDPIYYFSYCARILSSELYLSLRWALI